MNVARILKSKWVWLGLAGKLAIMAAVVLLAGEWCARPPVVPETAQEPKNVSKWERVQGGQSYVALKPPQREIKRIERDYRVDLTPAPGQPAREILAIRELPKIPSGGTALITMPPGGGEIEVTVRANRAKFFEVTSVYGVGGLYGLGQDGTRWRGYAHYTPFRVGRFYGRVEAGMEGRQGETEPYVMAGIEWRSAE